MRSLVRALFVTVAALGLSAQPAAAQFCPSHPDLQLFQGYGYDGDEPEDFTHYVDENEDGICDFVGDTNDNGECDEIECAPVVAWDEANGVHPNGVYPDCMLVEYQRKTPEAEVYLQIGHGHWEYTHLQTDMSGAPEEKDYLTITQAMQTDLVTGNSAGTQTLGSIEQTMRFILNEPARFERFVLTNPSGRFWQVDEWIGPAFLGILDPLLAPIPLLTWQERFFVCGDQNGVTECARVNGVPAFGGYWSNHMEQFGYIEDCGDGQLDDPEPELDDPVDPDGRQAGCGTIFVDCSL